MTRKVPNSWKLNCFDLSDATLIIKEVKRRLNREDDSADVRDAITMLSVMENATVGLLDFCSKRQGDVLVQTDVDLPTREELL